MRYRRGEGGQALLETAMTSLVLFLVVFGIIEFGRAMFSYHAVANGARMGTRYALVRGKDSGILVSQAQVSTYVKSVLSLNPNEVTVATTWQDGQKTGTWVRVQVAYNFHFIIPVASVTMTSHSQIVVAR
jgi:Flp pilus assembly protein TadG